MHEIFKQYGGAILVSVAFTLIMAILFVAWPEGGGSFVDAVGGRSQAKMETHVVDWDAKQDGAAFNTHAARSKPQVHIDRHVMEGESTTLDDFMTITNTDGSTWSSERLSFTGEAGKGRVEIHSILGSNGDDIKDEISSGPYYQSYTFAGPDDLVIHMTITDEDGVSATYRVPVAVDRLPVEE